MIRPLDQRGALWFTHECGEDAGPEGSSDALQQLQLLAVAATGSLQHQGSQFKSQLKTSNDVMPR